MPQTFVVDQAASFSAVVLLSCEPRIAFGSKTGEQERTKDGVPKWECQLVAGFRDSFGRVGNEVIKVGIVAESNPAEGVPQFSPVTLRRFEVGVMDAKGGGAQVWYRAESIAPIGAVPRPAAAVNGSANGSAKVGG